MELLLSLLVGACETGSSPTYAIERDRTRANYSQIIRAAEEYTLANVDDRNYVADLCRVAGVSEPTLQQAFQNILQISPIAYLNRVKLHRARANLRAASPGDNRFRSGVGLGFLAFWRLFIRV